MTVTSNTNLAAALPSGFHAFWRWWAAELRTMVPPVAMGWIVGDVAVADITVSKSEVATLRNESGKLVPSMAIPLAEVSTSTVLREMRNSGNDQLRLLLQHDQVLVKTLTLPAAIEENLREAIGFELDRHTPFKPDQVYYDVSVVSRDPQRESIAVTLVAAARSIVDPLVATLRNAGFAVVAIGILGNTHGAQMPELLPAAEKPARKWGNLVRLNLALLALTAVFALIALLLPIWQKREIVVALNPVMAKTNTEYTSTVQIQDEFTRLANEYNYIAGRKHTAQPALVVLEELSRISPDTTWVQSLDLKTSGKTRELTLIGEAQTASRVIESLEQSALFQNATQRSPTQRGSQPNTERYHVATELKPKLAPAAVAVEALAPPAITTNAVSVMASPPTAPTISTNPTLPLAAPMQAISVGGETTAKIPIVAPIARDANAAAAQTPGPRQMPISVTPASATAAKKQP